MKEWKPLVEWFGERYVSKNIGGMHRIKHFFFFGTGKFYWASSFNDIGQPCFVIIFCEILNKPFLHIIVLLPANSIYSCFLKEMFHGTISTMISSATLALSRVRI